MKKSMFFVMFFALLGVASLSAQTATVPRQVLIEHFSSSTCGPCVSVNNQMNTLTINNPGKYCYVKYQMNWPGNGDPYYTAEGGIRRSYYGVDAVPHVVAEGNKFSGNAAISQIQFNNFYAAPAYVDIRGSFNVTDDEITIHVDVFPNLSAENVKMYVVVNEKITHNNIGGNGESTFHHIMMKMLPNGQGSTINLVDGELQSFDFTHNMSGTHVEEMSDLEVAVFIQKPSTKEIFNSRFMYEYSDFIPSPVRNLQMVNTGNNSIDVTWENPLFLSPSGYNVYVNSELVTENISGTYYSIINATEDSYAVQVEAVFEEEGMSSVLVTETISMSDCSVVSNLNAASNDNNIHVTWNAAANAVSYDLYRNVNGTTWEVLASGIIATEYVDEAVAEGDYCYKIKSICEDGESDFSEEACAAVVGMDEFAGNFEVYPNPAGDYVKIEGDYIEIINIYNTLGQLVKSVTVNGNTINLSVSDLQQGIYLFDIKTVDSIRRERVIIAR